MSTPKTLDMWPHLEEIFSERSSVRYTMAGEGLYMAGRMGEAREAMGAADLKPGEKFLDLGSGDGRVACVAAALGARSKGIEADPALHARAVTALKALDEAGIHLEMNLALGDFLDGSFSDADVIFYYAGGNTRRQTEIYSKLEREMKSGARLIVYRTARIAPLGLTLTPTSRPPQYYIYLK